MNDKTCYRMRSRNQQSLSDNKDDRTIVLRTMRALDSSVYKRPRPQNMPEMFCGLWRRQIVEWMYVLIKYCKLKHEATAAAVYYLDAAVACDSSIVKTPRDYQLCAMTALHLALKVYDSPTVRVVKLSCLVKLGNGEFTEADIIQKEQELLRALGWRINPPTADCFLQRYMELLPFLDDDKCENDIDLSDTFDPKNEKENERDEQLGPIEQRRQKRLRKLEEVASEFIEVALARDRFLFIPSSVIAYAALLSAMELTVAHARQQQTDCYYDWTTFFLNMTNIAEMGDTFDDFTAKCAAMSTGYGKYSIPPSVRRTKMLLDNIVKGLPLPPEEEDIAFFSPGLAGNSLTKEISNGKIENRRKGNNTKCSKPSAPKSSSPLSPTAINTASFS